jgi:hypothetical protein
MKKVTLSLLAFGLIGAGAFAQAAAPTVTISDWGRQIVAVGSMDGGVWATTGASWGGAPRIVGLNIQAKTDTVGFSITPSADNGVFGLTDQNKAWVNPLPGWTVEAGISLETDTWRGADGFGSWNWLRFAQENGDNVTFSRLGAGGYDADINYNKDGIGFWALAHFGGTGSTIKADTNAASGYSVNNASPSDALNNAFQIGAAYTITGLGQLKAQVLGYDSGAENINTLFSAAGGIQTGKKFSTVQVAFNLSAVKDLSEELGVQLPTAAADAGYSFQISSITGYTMDKTTLHLEVIGVNYTGDNAVTATGKKVSGLALGGGVGLDYDLGDSVGVSGDVRYRNALAANSGNDKTSAGKSADAFTGFSIGVTKGFSNGLIGLGFEYASKGYGFAFGSPNASQGNWAIPLRLEESF